MKHNYLSVIVALSLFLQMSCMSQTNETAGNKQELSSDNLEVLYFHFERRCATCLAVEKVTREAVKELYSGAVIFDVFNLDDKEGKEMAEKRGVSSQALIIVKGDIKIDITSESFLYARSNPEKLKTVLREKIDPIL